MASATQWNTGQLLGASSSYWQASTIHAAVKLEVFTVLGGGELSAAEAASRIGASERGLAMLLNGLTALGLLEHKGKQFLKLALSNLMF